MKIRRVFSMMVLAFYSWLPQRGPGNIPEFDAVGCDAANFFAKTNLPYIVVTWQNDGYYGGIEWQSVFPKGRFANYEEFHHHGRPAVPGSLLGIRRTKRK